MPGVIRGLILALMAGAAACAADPVGWRNDGTGRFADADPPTEWSTGKNVLWKASLPGQSYAAPIVVGENLYVASDPADLLCIRRKDGKVLWRKGHGDIKAPAGGGGGKGGFGKGGMGKGGGGRSAGNTAATPVSDGKYVAAVFGNGVVAVYDLDGNRLWGRAVESSRVGFGHSTSPLLLGGKLIVHFNSLVALDVATGKEAWRVELSASHASPVAAKLGKEDVVISPAGAVIRARDGKTLAEAGMRSSDNSPVADGDTVFFVGRGAFRLTEGKDGAATVKRLWGTGGGGGGGRGDRRLSSPLVHDGILYGIGGGGFLEAADARTGEPIYRQRLGLGEVYSSLAMAGGLIYAFDLSGKAVIFKPGRKYERVAACQLEGTGCCPVFAGSHLYVRGRQTLYCIAKEARPKE